ncbi:MAG: hypothetical protein CL549_15845 [Alcanivorax sp.]|nr:hypothetical protein [Alcanivorax sp.]MAY11931.1 hypothetical protein [Alcanivorax sp.]MBI56753.1 hypothetical protein [Alcanivorax sp.]HCE39699.1 hypothetical protein [Alcanivorax sp.]|tara:strand:- start:268 stop:459 length:192 start_codon:yes stop_codon:yes gene_type:complete
MKRVSLSEFVEEHGQTRAGELLGLTQGGIGKALRSGRQIYVTETDGIYQAHEVKPFPASRNAA